MCSKTNAVAHSHSLEHRTLLSNLLMIHIQHSKLFFCLALCVLSADQQMRACREFALISFPMCTQFLFLFLVENSRRHYRQRTSCASFLFAISCPVHAHAPRHWGEITRMNNWIILSGCVCRRVRTRGNTSVVAFTPNTHQSVRISTYVIMFVQQTATFDCVRCVLTTISAGRPHFHFIHTELPLWIIVVHKQFVFIVATTAAAPQISPSW